MCLASLASILWLYQGHDAFGPGLLAAVFFVGFCTASFYGWLPLYLPELFHTRVRGTGPRLWIQLRPHPGRDRHAPDGQSDGTDGFFGGGYPEACSVMSAVYLLGLVLIVFAPETRGQPLPD